MELKRKLYASMLQWKETSHGTSALMINGARRVGKSYIVEMFAKKAYRNYILIDFSVARTDRRITDTFKLFLSDLPTFFQRLSTIYGKSLYERETLFIFDEVQRYPRAREAFKALVAHGKYDYIETGSLVSIQQNVKNILIPSEEDDLDMNPLDFEEFLWAKGNFTLMDYIRECFAKRQPLGDLHRTAMDALREYMIVGGMPQAVNKYIETRDFRQVDKEKRRILNLYRKGLREHAGKLAERVEALFDFIPSQLQEHEKRVVLTDLAPEARMRDYQDPIFWLKDARVINVAYNATEPNVGLRLSLDHQNIKCYFGDTGLLISHAFDENSLITEDIHNRLLFENISLNKGMLTENLVAQMLTAANQKLYFLSRANPQNRQEQMEIDFLLAKSKLTRKHNIIPIEVKSGKNTTHTSLDKLRAKYAEWLDTPFLLWDKDLQVKDGITYIPFYMAPCL